MLPIDRGTRYNTVFCVALLLVSACSNADPMSDMSDSIHQIVSGNPDAIIAVSVGDLEHGASFDIVHRASCAPRLQQ